MVAACLGGGMLLAALAMSQNFQDGTTLAAEETQVEDEVSLAIAGQEESETDATADTESQETTGEVKLSVAGTAAEEETSEETVEEETSETEAETDGSDEAASEEENTNTSAAETLETTTTGEDGIVAMDVSQIVENCMPSIVAITNVSVEEVESYFYGTQEIESTSAGSGIIIAQNDDELMIATNNHVVEDSKDMTVCFSVDVENPEDAIVPAVTKGTNSEYDLAVVAVKLSDIPEDVLSQLKIATLGSSDDLKVGETAIAIGNALGTGQTVTCGIISALEREVTTDVGTFTELQTDAAINLGCSGGALLNRRGEVIGINSAKATGDYAESMGYAIPIDTAIPVLTELINRETREVVENHGYLGITVVSVSDEAKEMYNMPAGAFVYEVTEGSAAEQAGMKQGDIITKFDGITIDSNDALVDLLEYYEAGETVTVEVQVAENGSYVSKELEVTLQAGTEDSSQDSEEVQEDESEEDQTPDGENVDPGLSENPRSFYDYFYGDEGNNNGGFFGDNGIF